MDHGFNKSSGHDNATIPLRRHHYVYLSYDDRSRVSGLQSTRQQNDSIKLSGPMRMTINYY